MSRFLRLKSCFVNVNHIRFINIKPDEYDIKIAGDEVKGFLMLGSGTLDTGNTYLKLNKKDDLEDYNTVSEWMLSEKNNNVWR